MKITKKTLGKLNVAFKKEAEYRELAKRLPKKELENSFVLLSKDVDFLNKKVQELEQVKDKIIAYIDKFGRKWEKKAIDEIFEALAQKKKIDNVLDYYAFEED